MSVIEYKPDSLTTGLNLGFAALLLSLGGANITHQDSIAQVVDFSYVNIKNIDNNIFLKSSSTITKYSSTKKSRYINDPEVIVKNAFEQINGLNFIQVDDIIDKEIDVFFANREIKTSKKILYKRT